MRFRTLWSELLALAFLPKPMLRARFAWPMASSLDSGGRTTPAQDTVAAREYLARVALPPLAAWPAHPKPLALVVVFGFIVPPKAAIPTGIFWILDDGSRKGKLFLFTDNSVWTVLNIFVL